MNRKEIVEAVRREFPKFSPTALSLGLRPSETGIAFVRRAAEIIVATGGLESRQKTREDSRTKNVSFRCRLAPGDAGRVKNEMTRHGVNQQNLLEALLVEWAAWSENEPLPVGKTGNGSKGGNKEDAPASRISKNLKEVNMQDDIAAVDGALDGVRARRLNLMCDHANMFRYLNKCGLLSAEGLAYGGSGVHLRTKDFFFLFTEYTIEDYPADAGGYGHTAVGVFNGVRFFCLLDDEEFKEVTK